MLPSWSGVLLPSGYSHGAVIQPTYWPVQQGVAEKVGPWGGPPSGSGLIAKLKVEIRSAVPVCG